MPVKFELLEHPADIGFLAYGATMEELFANAALALISIAGDVEAVRETEQREIEATSESAAGEKTSGESMTGENTESLLYAWLAEILAVMDAERLALRRAEVTELREGRVRGTVFGEGYDRARHRSGVAIKAVTYHQFAIERVGDGWRARVYLDL